MEKEEIKASINEYDFLRLYAAIMTIQYRNPIFENHQLEKDLYKFHINPEYQLLFRNIKKNEEGNNVDLTLAYETAYATGLLIKLEDYDNHLGSMINITDIDAKVIISLFPDEQVVEMNQLCHTLLSLKNNKENKLAIKKNI